MEFGISPEKSLEERSMVVMALKFPTSIGIESYRRFLDKFSNRRFFNFQIPNGKIVSC